ncbi:VIN3-like protein 2 isoform X2 [Andrographis paniculata]|uniref:VIN3-like protein 2 isoform X2 n=1 Tax=Andrographis paniculata TaxID=175694 RepID=UPI0021E98F0F|nr:VIN3-like protein 2 isoform X2 [Andrographis paniculata]
MDASSLEELVFDPSKCSKLSIEQKREIVYEVSKWSDSGAEILHMWSRQDILQVLCAELGKERKYTGLTKSKIIEHLLKIVCEKKALNQGDANASEAQLSSENSERTPKRQKKIDNPTHWPVAGNSAATSVMDVDLRNPVYCKNAACKARMTCDDVFCKRCSCCICRKFDDNKDPSLWLICNADPPFHGVSCGMSCHLECALRHENSGILKDRQDKGLDGSFCCVSCGKVNDLLGSWRKQLLVARDTRRVDILCYRLSLCQKILGGTKHYQNLSQIVDEAVEKLEAEVGPLTGLPVKRARGIVNRLSSGPEIQSLCASAVETLDSILSERVSDAPPDCDVLGSKLIKFEDIGASSLKVVLVPVDSHLGNLATYMLWHRKSDDAAYPEKPTCRLLLNTKVLLSGLTPDTKYFLKVVTFDKDREVSFWEYEFRTLKSDDEARQANMEVERSHSPATNCSTLSNPSSLEDEANENDTSRDGSKSASAGLPGLNTNGLKSSLKEIDLHDVPLLEEPCLEKVSCNRNVDATFRNKDSSNRLITEEASNDHGPNTPQINLGRVPYLECSGAGMQITPYKLDIVKESVGRKNLRKLAGEEPQAGSSSGKRIRERIGDEESTGDKDFEYYVKVIRYLECDGHIETSFRQKFLTWYSLRATPQEIRIVKVFIDMFSDDPEALAEQLVDTFSDAVSNKRCSTVPSGFCTKLWH